MNPVQPRFLHNDSEPWMLGEDLPEIDLFFAQSWLHGFVNEMEGACGRAYKKTLATFRGLGCKFYFGEKDAEEFAVYLVEKLKREEDFAEKINRNIKIHSEKMVEHARKVPEDLSKHTNNELGELLVTHLNLHRRLYGWGMIPNAMDIYFPILTETLRYILKKQVSDEAKINEYFVALTAADDVSESAKEHIEFLTLATKIKAAGQERVFLSDLNGIKHYLHPPAYALIENHWSKFKHIKFLYNGFPATIDDYLLHLKEYFSSHKNPREEIDRIKNELIENRKKKIELEKQLHLSKQEIRLFNAYAGFMLSKFVRRYAQIYSLYKMDFVLREIGKRLRLNRVEVRNTLVPELCEYLETGKPDFVSIKQRANFNVMYAEKGLMLQFMGEEAKRLEEIAEKGNHANLDVKEFSGQVASLGFAKGKVKLIFTPEDMQKFVTGDILVAISTNPDVVPAMRKAAAIITEQGGVTSHAAIVSRELGVPCVIGTKIATKILKDGDLVEVDANKGLIRILEQI